MRETAHYLSAATCTVRTVRDLTFGAGIAFRDLGEHQLKGVPDTWRMYEVAPDHR